MSDTFTCAGILLEASKEVLLDEICSINAKTNDIPTDKSSLKTYLDSKLGGSWVVRVISETGGATSTYYSASSNNNTQPHKRVFVKLSSPTRRGRVLDTILGLGLKEADAYWKLFSNNSYEDIGIVTPKYLAAESSKYGSRYILVLEDLAANDDVILGKPGDVRNIAEIRTILHALAKLHAAFWGRGDDIPQTTSSDRASILAHIMAKSSLRTAKKDGLIKEGDVADRICTAVDYIGGFPGIERLIDDLSPDARTLVHGDIGHGNNYFDETGRVGLLDWQTYRYGNPADDVAGILFNDLSIEDFKKCGDELISEYLGALRKEMEVDVDHLFTIEHIKEAIRLKIAFMVTGSLLVLAMPSSEKSLKEKIRNDWDDVLEKAEVMGAADALEKHVEDMKKERKEKKKMQKKQKATGRSWLLGNRGGVHPVVHVEAV